MSAVAMLPAAECVPWAFASVEPGQACGQSGVEARPAELLLRPHSSGPGAARSWFLLGALALDLAAPGEHVLVTGDHRRRWCLGCALTWLSPPAPAPAGSDPPTALEHQIERD